MKFACAAKAFIVKDNAVLLVKRRPNDVHKPSEWDIPGGRLEPGENPHDGLKREAREEVGMDILICAPIHVQHFTRDDGQQISLTVFLCSSDTSDITLSEEHTEYAWVPLDAPEDAFPFWIPPVVSQIKEHKLLNALN